jgi:hypothetical protein
LLPISPTAPSTEEPSFDYQSSLSSSNSTTVKKSEVAMLTVLIRRKWTEKKDTFMSRLILDLRKPEIGGIGQWEILINSDNVNLDNFLPENIKNSFHHGKRKIKSFADWTVAFISFRKAVLYLFSHRRSELDIHFERISELSRASYSIKYILLYEADIRCQVAKMPHLSLFDDFSYLMSKHIMAVHSKTIDKTVRMQTQICLRYNTRFKRCEKSQRCSRLHICSICFNSMKVQVKHPAAFCRAHKKNQLGEHQSRLSFSIDPLATPSQSHVPPYYLY